ncbi:MAG: hypothetical protein IJ121_12700 [Eubacterium sp.]|nr:hypothetical protein [Eubacterium sp.]
MTKTFDIKEIWCSRTRTSGSAAPENYRIYGKAYIPDGGRYPLVIFSHELGKNYEAGVPYAERLAASGYAVYTFDYCGGTVFCNWKGEIVRPRRSSGETTDASLVTWIEDLTAVAAAAKTWEFVDPGKIFLAGGSQGAVSSALTACRDRQLQGDRQFQGARQLQGDRQLQGNLGIAGLILLYPPLDLPERMHGLFHSREQIPEIFDLFNGWIMLGKRYADDIWDFDVYGELAEYTRPVLILHGDKDDVVDISVSE